MSDERFRVLVCGGRDYSEREKVYATLDTLKEQTKGAMVVIHGNARGADRLAKEWCLTNGIEHRPFTPDWQGLGKVAGIVRNHEMLVEGKPELVLAFPGGRGTANMVAQAEKAGVPVRRCGISDIPVRLVGRG